MLPTDDTDQDAQDQDASAESAEDDVDDYDRVAYLAWLSQSKTDAVIKQYEDVLRQRAANEEQSK